MKPTQIIDLSVGDRFTFQGVEYVVKSTPPESYQSVPCENIKTGQVENFNPLADVLLLPVSGIASLDLSHVDDFDSYVDHLLLDTDAEDL